VILSYPATCLASDGLVPDRLIANRLVPDRLIANRLVPDRLVADRVVTGGPAATLPGFRGLDGRRRGS
jgi:hypothetical protein